MSDGIRDELRELLFDTAPPPAVDTEAMFEATFAADGPDGAELLPPDGLFDLPADDPADELLADDPAFDDPALDPGLDETADDSADEGGDTAGLDEPGAEAEPAWDAEGDPGDPGAPEVPFDEPGAGAGW
jgi:hypothetical protein